MYDDYDDGHLATEAEAHAEWHRNSGVPMGTPGCPQDACHPDEDEWRDEPAEEPDDPAPDPADFLRICVAAERYAQYLRNDKHRRHVDAEDRAHYRDDATRIEASVRRVRGHVDREVL